MSLCSGCEWNPDTRTSVGMYVESDLLRRMVICLHGTRTIEQQTAMTLDKSHMPDQEQNDHDMQKTLGRKQRIPYAHEGEAIDTLPSEYSCILSSGRNLSSKQNHPCSLAGQRLFSPVPIAKYPATMNMLDLRVLIELYETYDIRLHKQNTNVPIKIILDRVPTLTVRCPAPHLRRFLSTPGILPTNCIAGIVLSQADHHE